MQVLLVEPGKEARPFEMEDTLKAMQDIVGGHIQATHTWNNSVALVCNEDGKLTGLPANRQLGNGDIVVGTFVVCGLKDDEFCSLSNKQMEQYKAMFQNPELFFYCDSGLLVKKCSPEEYAQVMQDREGQKKAAHKRHKEQER